jgi:hypothetical protein
MYLVDIEYCLSDEIGTVRCDHRGTINDSVENDSADVGGGSVVI